MKTKLLQPLCTYIGTSLMIILFFMGQPAVFGHSHIRVAANTKSYKQQTIIKGYIRDTNGNPLPHATVRIHEVNKTVETDEAGYYTISVDKEGSYKISVASIGHVTKSQTLSIHSGQSITLDWTLDKEERTIENIDVTGKSEIRGIKDKGFLVDVVDAKKLYNTSADLNQVLNRLPGVRIREDGGLGSDFRFSLNGFSGKSVKFFLDGIPMDNFGASLSLNNFPTNMTERIEVYKGVVPMTLGADALGGAINVVTRSNPNYLDASYSIGSFNTHKAGLNGAYTNKKTGLAIRFNGFYNYSDNDYKVTVRPVVDNTYQPEQEIKRFHDGYSSLGGQLEVGVRDKPYADQLFIGILAAKNDKDVQTGVVMEQVYGALTRNSSSVIPTLKYKKNNLFTEGLDFNFYGAYNISKNGIVDTVPLTYNWLQETIPNSENAEIGRTQLINRDREGLITSNLSYALSTNHSISLNYVLTDFTRKMSDVQSPDDPTHKMPQRLQKHNVGIGIENRFGGLRTNTFVKYYHLYAESFENVSQNAEERYEETSTKLDKLGYGIAGTYFFLSNLQAKASYEHSYRLPEPTELLGDGLFSIRNPEIKPEKSDNINLGALYRFKINQSHNFQTEINLIYRNSKDYIRLEQARNQPIGRKFINVGNVETTGAEGDIQYNWKNIFFAGINLSYQRIIDKTEFIYSNNLSGSDTSRNLNYGYKIPNIPYLFANLDLGARFHDFGGMGRNLNVHYLVNYIEKYFLTPQQLGNNNTDMIPRQIAHNVSADYSIANGKYNIAIECNNLTDSKLYDNYRLQKPTRSFAVKLRYFINK